jgi:hypothetical protein
MSAAAAAAAAAATAATAAAQGASGWRTLRTSAAWLVKFAAGVHVLFAYGCFPTQASPGGDGDAAWGGGGPVSGHRIGAACLGAAAPQPAQNLAAHHRRQQQRRALPACAGPARVQVDGPSMFPTLPGRGEWVLLETLPGLADRVQVGEAVARRQRVAACGPLLAEHAWHPRCGQARATLSNHASPRPPLAPRPPRAPPRCRRHRGLHPPHCAQ